MNRVPRGSAMAVCGGGRVITEPFDLPVGRLAVVAEPDQQPSRRTTVSGCEFLWIVRMRLWIRVVDRWTSM